MSHGDQETVVQAAKLLHAGGAIRLLLLCAMLPLRAFSTPKTRFSECRLREWHHS